jgi:serine/threonine protein kinase
MANLRDGRLRSRQRLGKYRIVRRLAENRFAAVYAAVDSIEGIRVALKVPHPHWAESEFFEDFRREVRLAARLEHPNILPLKDASIIDDLFVIVTPLGDRTLGDRMQNRMATRTALQYAEQALSAVAYAHSQRIIHCDIKPDNFIIFGDDRLRLADFGIAKMGLQTIDASGSGTLGYMAPEQAMGQPTCRSDVFALGLLFYQMFSGVLPDWPYEWPLEGHKLLRSRVHPEMVKMIQKAIDLRPAKRFRDGQTMLAAFRRLRTKSSQHLTVRQKKKVHRVSTRNWQDVREKAFKRMFGTALGTRFACRSCGGPVSERMIACPWCGTSRRVHREDTRFPSQCGRCKRGIKRDWKYCPTCYGRGLRNVSTRPFPDKAYAARCSNPDCDRKELMPFMKYCPWCRRSVKKKWKITGSTDTCLSCGWGVVLEYWSTCPWCTKSL